MKVKDLIEALEVFHPDANIAICAGPAGLLPDDVGVVLAIYGSTGGLDQKSPKAHSEVTIDVGDKDTY